LLPAASIAAYGCLRAINTLMESVAGLGAQLYPAFEEALLPMLQKYISSDGQDIIEEVGGAMIGCLQLQQLSMACGSWLCAM
jgi:hypothetical protein